MAIVRGHQFSLIFDSRVRYLLQRSCRKDIKIFLMNMFQIDKY